jgi:hypothetical protein
VRLDNTEKSYLLKENRFGVKTIQKNRCVTLINNKNQKIKKEIEENGNEKTKQNLISHSSI